MKARLESLKQGVGGIFVLLAAVLFMARAQAQLAITEVMSFPSEIGDSVLNNSDFWELTNFGSDSIDISEFTFTDADHRERRYPLVNLGEPPLFIHPLQSILFVRNDVSTNQMQFRDRWASCVASNALIRFYSDPGLSRYGDSLLLYDGSHDSSRMVDHVNFPGAAEGVSFVYDTTTGLFGRRSVAGTGGACRPEMVIDVASPGRTAGLVPLRIVKEPESVVIYPQLNTTLTIEAVGLPRPRYQWLFEGIPISGATQPSLTLSNIDSAIAGTYFVQVSNGISNLVSSNATVTLNQTPTPPKIISPPLSLTVLADRTARFNVTVAALPLPSYQWFFNGVRIDGVVGPSLIILNCTLDMSGGEVRVRAENSLGAVSASARLYVTTKLDLRITELQADPRSGCEDHRDWFEVTNFGTNDIQLLGYRFNDDRDLETALVVTQPLVVYPRESVIFVNDSSVGSFIEWWGADNLPPELKVVPYSGFRLNQKDGETLYLWSDTAEELFESIDELVFAESTKGISLFFDKDSSSLNMNSVLGQAGAFRAIECGDIGSPGYTSNPPPRFVSVTRNESGARLRWRAIQETRYQIMYRTSLANNWATLGFMTATGSLAEIFDSGARNSASRFYQVIEVAP
jgi:hypothetical protein